MTSWWVQWRLKSPASPLFTQPFIQAQIKENIKAPRQWPLCWKFTGDWWIPRTNGQQPENVCIWWRHHTQSPNRRFWNFVGHMAVILWYYRILCIVSNRLDNWNICFGRTRFGEIWQVSDGYSMHSTLVCTMRKFVLSRHYCDLYTSFPVFNCVPHSNYVH